ncbi:MAG TPA: hypothetical protein VFX19_02990 [Dehalococcoidia bacterium]|jgi:hypothetical protein|nr:hypothetical protein [Dehalococcoidia bacterium]
MTNNLYGEVESLQDLRDINRQIRKEMRQIKDREHLTELKKRADYLCTLTLAPSWQERFGKKSRRMLAVAKQEDERTTRIANSIAKRKGIEARYNAWQGG